ncbi:MAG: HAD-IA family hydrolase [Nanoarchaeota archaeon]|nr:HAD-IA family hydrolase [Nanoarchaeota archaeon]
MKMIKAVLFDLDNTLIDFMKMKRLSCEEAISAMIDAGLPLDKEEAIKKLFALYQKHGIEHQKIFQLFLKETMGKIDWRILASGVVAYRRIKASFLEPYPHTLKTLIELKKKGIKLAILSDAPKLEAYTRLAATKLMPFFDVILTLDDTKAFKPAKQAFLLALKRLGTKPEETLMVGDWHERDIVGAKKVGMKTAYAIYGTIKEVKSTADYDLASIKDILKVVR